MKYISTMARQLAPFLRPGALVAVVGGVLISASGCGDDLKLDDPYANQFSLYDVSTAPASIQAAARAVVSVVTAAGRGTGFFVDADGLMMTNEHVLGASNCVRDGCYIDIGLRYEKGARDTQWHTVRAMPIYADQGLDVGLYRLYPEEDPEDGSNPLPIVSPSVLELSDAPPLSTVDQPLYVVGHPFGLLKKWVFGLGHDLSGNWLETTNFIVPGNSGSPLLSLDGKVVGLMHRSDASAERRLNEDGAALASYGTTAEALREATGVSTGDALTENTDLFMWADQADTLTLLTAARQTNPDLALDKYMEAEQACDEQIETYSNHVDYPNACSQALSWLECPDADASDPTSNPPRFCPEESVLQQWKTRADQLNDLDLQILGAPTGLWIYDFAMNDSSAAQVEVDRVIDAWEATEPVISQELAATVLQYSQRKTMGGVNIERLVQSYRFDPVFYFDVNAILSGLFSLRDRGVIDRNRLLEELTYLLEHGKTPLFDRLVIESILQASGLYRN